MKKLNYDLTSLEIEARNKMKKRVQQQVIELLKI
jgi:hypothetical protein